MKELSLEEQKSLVEKYKDEEIPRPGIQEYRYDDTSSRLLYALLREYQPTNAFEFGTSWGGSALVINAALIKNGKKFTYTGAEKVEGYRDSTINALKGSLDVEPTILRDVQKEEDQIPDNLDFAFIDPDWDGDIAPWTWEKILPKLKDGALVHIHDLSAREIDGVLTYEGGSFYGIQYLIEKYNNKDWPFEKIFNVWDYPEYRAMSIASSFWIYRRKK